MAFKDITRVLYDGRIKVDYKDGIHRYYARKRINWDLPETDKNAWSKVLYPSGVTTLMGDTLEKSGLMNYAMTQAMKYLFGFYEFTDDNGEKKMGYTTKGKQALWGTDDHLLPLSKDEALEVISYGSKASQRHTKQGAKIGSVVHDAIEHYITDQPFDIAEQYMWELKNAGYEDERIREEAMKDYAGDVEMAKLAFNRFTLWWEQLQPTLYGAEDLLYSEEENISGTYDGDLGIKLEHHPVYSKPFDPELGIPQELYDKMSKKKEIRATTDWKTSNATASKQAAAPEGIFYTYFLQDALYEKLRREMGYVQADDLFVVSARKDGEFTTLFASECGLTVDDCLEWAECVIYCFRMMKNIKDRLWQHGLATGAVVAPEKKSRSKK